MSNSTKKRRILMWKINKNAKTIKEEGYSYVLNQCLKVGTHIFSIGTAAENYRVYEEACDA